MGRGAAGGMILAIAVAFALRWCCPLLAFAAAQISPQRFGKALLAVRIFSHVRCLGGWGRPAQPALTEQAGSGHSAASAHGAFGPVSANMLP